jgi:hypothetical protein
LKIARIAAARKRCSNDFAMCAARDGPVEYETVDLLIRPIYFRYTLCLSEVT